MISHDFSDKQSYLYIGPQRQHHPRSQGPLLLGPSGERERDPGLVWSRV